MMQALALTKAPIIASHSAVRALCNHSRNLDDEQLLALKKNGGVIQIVAFCGYVKTPPRFAGARRGARGAPQGVRPAGARAGAGGGGGGRGARSRSSRRRQRAGVPARGRRTVDKPVPAASARDRQGLRRSHRLRREADRHRSRRHLVGLRRRRRRRRLERRRARRSTSRSSWCAAATPRSRSRRFWSGNLLRVMEEVAEGGEESAELDPDRRG